MPPFASFSQPTPRLWLRSSLMKMFSAICRRRRPRLKDCLRYIRWARRSRRIGQHISFGVVPKLSDRVVGIFQLWPIGPGFQTAEWGFALDPAFWGTGLFIECAEQIVDFAMDHVGVRRLEARAAAGNGRGNGALRKLGAEREGVLRQCYEYGGPAVDHVMWAITIDDWRRLRESRLCI